MALLYEHMCIGQFKVGIRHQESGRGHTLVVRLCGDWNLFTVGVELRSGSGEGEAEGKQLRSVSLRLWPLMLSFILFEEAA